MLFVTLFEDYQILFDKRMTPKIKYEKLTAGVYKILGRNLDARQILKKI